MDSGSGERRAAGPAPVEAPRGCSPRRWWSSADPRSTEDDGGQAERPHTCPRSVTPALPFIDIFPSRAALGYGCRGRPEATFPSAPPPTLGPGCQLYEAASFGAGSAHLRVRAAARLRTGRVTRAAGAGRRRRGCHSPRAAPPSAAPRGSGSSLPAASAPPWCWSRWSRTC